MTNKNKLYLLLKRIKSRLTMKRGMCLFVDKCDGKEVFEYTDCFGDKYMANYDYITSTRIRRDK